MEPRNVASEMVDEWTARRSVIAEIAAEQDSNLCFVCQERTYFKKFAGLGASVGICRPCEEAPVED